VMSRWCERDMHGNQQPGFAITIGGMPHTSMLSKGVEPIPKKKRSGCFEKLKRSSFFPGICAFFGRGVPIGEGVLLFSITVFGVMLS
jgi:hypothetical protein